MSDRPRTATGRYTPSRDMAQAGCQHQAQGTQGGEGAGRVQGRQDNPCPTAGRRICGQLRKLHRKQKRRRENAAHQHSRQLADTAHAVVIENLNTQGMTKSAKGTEENPGTNVKRKSSLNREILASGWGCLERNLDYKAGQVVRVDPAYTSQTWR